MRTEYGSFHVLVVTSKSRVKFFLTVKEFILALLGFSIYM